MTDHLSSQPDSDASRKYRRQFASEIEEALKRWRLLKAANPLQRWHLFRSSMHSPDANIRQIVSKRLIAELEKLGNEEPRIAEILKLRFLEEQKVDLVANRKNLDNSRIHTLQAEGIDAIVDALWRDEEQALAEHRRLLSVCFDLPPTDHLIGIEACSAKLYEMLKSLSPPWIVALEGIGGIGKTSLASYLFSTLLDYSEYKGFAWVSAKQNTFNLNGVSIKREASLSSEALTDALLQQLEHERNDLHLLPTAQKQAMLQQRFKSDPHFVVIDNLETVEDIEALLPLLERWSNPTRFLLTSRTRYESDSLIHHCNVPELNESDALHLIRTVAIANQTSAIVSAADEKLREIYRVVGGNPLALRLVVGWSRAQGLPLVLEDLRLARGKRVEELYTYIYRKAWEGLDEAAQLTWLAMPLLHEKSATLAEIVSAMDDLGNRPDEHGVRYALERLVQLNLVDAQSDLNTPHYSIHPLTRTFLQEQIGKWLT